MRRSSLGFLSIALLVAVAVAGCKKTDDESPEESVEAASKPAESETPADPSEPETDPAAVAMTPDHEADATSDAPTGVEECDDLIEKYTACVRAKAPETSREETLQGFQANVDAWVKAATDEAKRSELAAGCKQTAEELKKSSEGWGCEW